MACDVKLSEISREHPRRDTRIAAQLVLAHAQTCYPPIDTVAVAETFADFYNIGATEFNRVCCEAEDRFADVFVAAMMLWRGLLPEAAIAAGACVVGLVAGQLWGGIRSAEPTPPKLEGTGGTVKLRTKAEDSPPQPTLVIPPEAEIADRRPQPPAIIPTSAPVSLRGLALRRQQERGVDSVW